MPSNLVDAYYTIYIYAVILHTYTEYSAINWRKFK
jgi:hypothetical protein